MTALAKPAVVEKPSQEDDGATRRPVGLSSRQDPFWASIVIRLATAGDRRSIEVLAELDSATPPIGETLLGTLDGRVVVALSLSDGAAIADPFLPTADILALVRLRAQQLRPRPGRWPRWLGSGRAAGRAGCGRGRAAGRRAR